METLANISLFSGLNEETLNAIDQLTSTRSYPKNSIIINEGDVSNSLYLLLSGRVKIFLSDEDGREFVVTNLEPGGYFGEWGLLDDERRSASVMTIEKCSFKLLHQKDFDYLRAQYPEINDVLMKHLVQRVRELTDNIKTLALKDVYGRIRKLLGDLSDKADDQIIQERLTQQEIANRVGSSREMVARILKDLTMGGYLHIEKKQIQIKKALPENY